jgi:hypothetical protein
MTVYSVTIGLIFDPFTFKYVPIYMPKLSFPVCLIFFPISLIPGPVRPDLYPEPMLEIVGIPLSFIDRSIFKNYFGPIVSYSRTGIARLTHFIAPWGVFKVHLLKLSLEFPSC